MLSYLIVSNCGSLSGDDEVFFICQRSFANVVKLIVRDSTGQDNSRASIIWHGVHILFVGFLSMIHILLYIINMSIIFEGLRGIRPQVSPDLMSSSPFDLQKINWKENLAVHQKSLGALFQALPHF